MNDPCTPLPRCLACGGADLMQYANFGSQPLANDFHASRREGGRYPLGLNVCLSCWHSQQLVAVEPDLIYRDYPYVSGTSQTLRDYFSSFARNVETDFDDKVLRVLDIASNDGSLLKAFKERGHEVQGVDPATNLSRQQQANGVPTIARYWDTKAAVAASPREHPGFDVIIAMNVLGHVEHPDRFLALCRNVLAPGGRIYVQTSQAHMVKNNEFDTCYHEHLSFFTCRSFRALAKRANLIIEKISYVPVHGTSYLVELVHHIEQESPYESAIELDEKLWGYYSRGIYQAFGESVDIMIDHVASTLLLARREGYRVYGYGAAAKGMNFLNISGIALDCVVDDAPLKYGKFCAGSNAPVVSPMDGRLQDWSPIMWLILPWNFRSEIAGRIKALRPNAPDRFMTYFPYVQVTTE